MKALGKCDCGWMEEEIRASQRALKAEERAKIAEAEADQRRSTMARDRDVVRRFLEDLELKGIDLTEVVALGEDETVLGPCGPRVPNTIGVDQELLIQLRDLVRRPA